MKAFLFLIGLLGLQAVAQESLAAQPDLVTRDESLLLSRAPSHKLKGRPKCSVELFTSGRYTPIPGQASQPKNKPSRRDEEELNDLEPRNYTSLDAFLAKREMTLPAGTSDAQMNTFLVEEGAKKTNRLLAWRPPRQKIARDVNNAAFNGSPGKRKPNPFGYGLDHLAGCTGLMIVSRSGIYGGHYWENIGFNLDKDIHGDEYKDQDDAFQKSIVDALHNGKPGHSSLTEAAKTIAEDDSIKAFLMVPDEGPAEEGETPKPDPYTEYWGKMQDEIGKIIPKLKDKNDKKRWEIVKYHPVQDEERQFELDDKGDVVKDEDGDPICTYDPMDDTYRGRMLCKFDPDHDGKRKITLWIENKQYHDDTWEYKAPEKV